jgi:hypothetical protein
MWIAGISLALATEIIVGVTVEARGSGDDRVASSFQDQLRAQSDVLLACWNAHPQTNDDELWSVQLLVYTRTRDGSISRSRMRRSTGDDALDACVTDLVLPLVATPVPVYPDSHTVIVSFRVPTAPPPKT